MALNENPGNVYLRYKLSEAQAGTEEAAVNLVIAAESLLLQSPDTISTSILAAELLSNALFHWITRGNTLQALKAGNFLVEHFPPHPVILCGMSEALFIDGDIVTAAHYANLSLTTSPPKDSFYYDVDSFREHAHYVQWQIACKTGDTNYALSLCKAALAEFPTSSRFQHAYQQSILADNQPPGFAGTPKRSTMYPVFLADTFSADEAGLFGRAMANRRLLTAILLCEEINTVYTTAPCSAFSCLGLPDVSLKKIVHLTSLTEVDTIFAENRIRAIFCSDFIANFADWIHYRNAHGLAAAVFGFTHSLSYQRFTSGIYQILCSRPSQRDGILCTSLCAEEVLERLFEQVRTTLSIETVPPSLLRFPLPVQWDTVPQETDKKDAPFQVLFIGRLDWQTKADLLTLKSIIPQLSSALAINFVIAGPADNEAYLMLLHRELEPLGVTIRLSVSEEEKKELYEKSHVLFSPSDNYQETFGLTVIEAMGHGCVPVVTDFDGYRDLVPEGRGFRLKTVAARIPQHLFAAQGVVSEGTYHGWWSAGVSFDPLEAAGRIEQLARDRTLWRRMSSAARETVTDYSLPQTSKRVGSLIRRHKEEDGESSVRETTTGANPFIWDFTNLFGTHPTELWDNQLLTLTEAGAEYIASPYDLPQFILLSHAVKREDIRKFLFLLKRGYDVGACLKRDIEPIVMSLALKNGLVTLNPPP